MQKYLIILTAPTLHFMFEPDDYFEPYLISTTTENLNYWIEKAERIFCKKTQCTIINNSTFTYLQSQIIRYYPINSHLL